MSREHQQGERLVEAFPLPLQPDPIGDSWDVAIDEADAAYRAWCVAATPAERRSAFAVYRAAEQREAAAAAGLRKRYERD